MMRGHRFGLAAAGLCIAAAAQAQLQWQGELGAGAEDFTSGAPTWRQYDAAVRVRTPERLLAEASVRRTDRYEAKDTEFGFAAVLPAGDWIGSAALTLSPTHEALPSWGVRLGAARVLADGWVVGLEASRQLFDRADLVDTGIAGTERVVGSSAAMLNVERYAGAWRFAAGVGRVRLDGGESGGTARLQLDRFYADERGRVGAVIAGGQEFENLPPTALRPSAIFSITSFTVALVGVHPLDAAWSLSWALSSTRNGSIEARYADGAVTTGDSYHRNGVRLGVQRDF